MKYHWVCRILNRAPSAAASIVGVVIFMIVSARHSAVTAADAEVHALIIGVSDYQDGTLKHAAPFAKDVAIKIKKTYPNSAGNIRTLLDKDATVANIHKVLFEELTKVPDNSLIIFYFAGHGIRKTYRNKSDATSISDCLLVLHGGTDKKPWGFSIKTQDIVDAIKRSRKCNWMVLIDCCFAGTQRPSFLDPTQFQQNTIGVRAFMLTASDSRNQTWNGIFTEELLNLWEQESPCPTPPNLEKLVQGRVIHRSGGYITPELIFGKNIDICISELNQPGFLLICEPAYVYPGPLHIQVDNSPVYPFTETESVFRRHLRRKKHRLKITCLGKTLYENDVEPGRGQDSIHILIDERPDGMRLASNPSYQARMATDAAMALEAFGADPASLGKPFYRAASLNLRASSNYDATPLLGKVYEYTKLKPQSLEHSVAALALGKRDFLEVNGTPEVALQLSHLGYYEAAGEGFRILGKRAQKRDDVMKYWHQSIVNLCASNQEDAFKTATDISLDKNLIDKDATYLRDLNIFCGYYNHPLESYRVKIPPISSEIQSKNAENLATQLDVLPAEHYPFQRKMISTKFNSNVADAFKSMEDPSLTLAIALNAVEVYRRRSLIDDETAKKLANSIRKQWAAKLGVDAKGDQLTDEERKVIRVSPYSNWISPKFSSVGIKTRPQSGGSVSPRTKK